MPDDLVLTALLRLPIADQRRALRDIASWLDHVRTMHAAAGRGVRVAPRYRLPVHEQLFAESTRRARCDDASWVVWEAYGETVRRSVPGEAYS